MYVQFPVSHAPVILSSNTTPVTASSNVAFTNLMGFTIPAGAMKNNGDTVDIFAGLEEDLSAGCTIRLTIGGVVRIDFHSGDSGHFAAHVTIARLSATTSYVYTNYGDGASGFTQDLIPQSITFSSALLCQFTAEVDSVDDKVIQRIMNVQYTSAR